MNYGRIVRNKFIGAAQLDFLRFKYFGCAFAEVISTESNYIVQMCICWKCGVGGGGMIVINILSTARFYFVLLNGVMVILELYTKLSTMEWRG